MWFTATLSQPRNFLAATSSNNQLFFGGGQNDTYNTNAVDIFIIPSSMIPCSSSLSPQSPGLSTSSFPFSSSTQIPSTASPFISPATNSVVTSTSSSAAPHNASSTASTGVIVGILVAIVALLIGIGLILFFILFVKRRRQKNKQNQNSASSVSQTNIKTVNSTESDPNYVTLNRLSPQQQFQTETMAESSFFESTQVKLQYSQISFSELVVGNEIGEGSYGKVCLGKWNNAVVALKFCRKRGKEEEFMREVRLMIKLPPHPNVVQMFGISLDGPQPIIILEYCAEGSLDKILFDSNVKLDDEYKMRLVREIAAGMYHLHKHNIVHRDLAARNILLTSGGAPKISDFGMSRILEKTEEGKSLSNIGPIRWMAPESISQQTYSKKSDVWTFGIVVWEIVCQREPHTNVNPVEVGILIRDRYLTPTIPNNCPQKLRQVMELCWQKQPDQRPGFETICAMLQ
jgi:predicted Ser/Thr protein kinase